MDRPDSTLERALVELAVELVLIVEDLPEDQIQLDTAVKLEESIASPTERALPSTKSGDGYRSTAKAPCDRGGSEH